MGKSTWTAQLKRKLLDEGAEPEVVSSDDIAYEICEELSGKPNVEQIPGAPVGAAGAIDYSTVWQLHGDEIEARYEARVSSGLARGNIVVVDRTFTTVARRAAALQLGLGVHPQLLSICVSFAINDNASYERNLSLRNSQLPDKQITPSILSAIKAGAVPPSQDEGFSLILQSKAILEEGWEQVHSDCIGAVINRVFPPLA